MSDKNDTNPTAAFSSALNGLTRNGVPMPDIQSEPVCLFREALMEEIFAKHSVLTRAELSKQMVAMGF